MNNHNMLIDAFTKLAPRYERVLDFELNLFWGWNYKAYVNYLMDQIPVGENDKILDVATGTAFIPIKIMQKKGLGNSIVGLDITEVMLKLGHEQIKQNDLNAVIRLACGDAMKMPFVDSSFDVVICALSTHHMDVPLMLSEMARVLRPEGRISVSDVGGAPSWRNSWVRTLLKIGAFAYYFIVDNYPRARAESASISNIRTVDEWRIFLEALGFSSISIVKLPSKYKWVPDPLFINAIKKR